MSDLATTIKKGQTVANGSTLKMSDSEYKDTPQFADIQCPVTLFKGISPTPTGNTVLGEMLIRMLDPDPIKRKAVLELRAVAEEAKKTGDDTKYKKLKSLLLGFILGVWIYRADAQEKCSEYSPLLVLDFDWSGNYEADLPPFSNEVRATIFEKIKAEPRTFAAFYSPSGGLRVIVVAESDYKRHRATYAALVAHYSKVTGLPTITTKSPKGSPKFTNVPFGIDASCHNESRFFYFVEGLTPDEFYCNENSHLFVAQDAPQTNAGAKVNTIEQPAPGSAPRQETAPELTHADRWEIYEQMTDERKSDTANAGRNGRVLFLAQLACEHGESESDILKYCNQFAETDFPKSEIERTVKSAIGRTSKKYSFEKLANYKAKRERKKEKDGEQKPEPIKSYGGGSGAYSQMIQYLDDKHEFRRDVVSNEIETREKNNTQWGELNENNILHELRQIPIKVSDAVLTSLLGSDYVHKFDPFLTYFKGLKTYDPSEGDHIGTLAGYVKLKDDSEREFFSKMYRKMLVRVAAAATLKIQFNKQCFVFGGCQGGGKSTFVRFHTPPALSKYRVDWTREEVNEKDGRFALAQNFIINLDELASFGKQNIEQTKALMSLDHIKDRLPYGKRPVRFPRRASFFGSTNKDEFLTDETGTVRWLVFEIESIQHDNGGANGYAANVDINGVWAQAWHLLNSGEVVPELSKDELKESEDRNKAYAVTTAEMETLIKYYEYDEDETAVKVDFFQTSQILKDLRDATGLNLNLNQLGAAIKRLGWPQRSKRTGKANTPVKGYKLRRLEVPGSNWVDAPEQANNEATGNDKDQKKEDCPF